MKWKLMKPRQRDEEEKQTTKKKPSTSSNSSPSSSSSSTFSISQLLPLSWLVSRFKSSSKRSATTLSRPAAKPFYSRPSPPLSPRPQKEPYPGHRPASPHLAFRHFAGDSDRVPARFPPPVAAPDVPHRRSLGDDGASRPSGIEHARANRRQWRQHHHSVGDLELTLGHLIPFSVLSRAVESDSGSDGSADTDARNDQLLRPPQRQRRRRRIDKAVQPSEADSGDVVLQRRSFGRRMRRPRARAKVRVSSPRNPAPAPPATIARRRRRRAEEGVTKATMELERFAVVTRSRDPHRDFRESMVEMIWEKGIGRPEELEDLLACYLSLNAKEHHDVIVKVFRQVWFELHPERFARSN